MKTMTAEEALALANQYTDTHGGGGGTSDYSQLTHKPSINDVELSGNKTASDLGLMPTRNIDLKPREGSQNFVFSGGVYEADEKIKSSIEGMDTVYTEDGTPVDLPSYDVIEETEMQFLPTQDLHGYDKPWAGGAGKNKYPIMIGRDIFDDNGNATHTTDADELTIAMTSTTNSGVYGSYLGSELNNISASLEGIYTCSFDITANKNVTLNVGYEHHGDEIINVTTSWQRVNVTTTFTNEGYAFIFYNRSGEDVSVNVRNFMLEEGSTATSYEPYSNICPISGQDNATLTDEYDNKYIASLGGTYYGGRVFFENSFYNQFWEYIASYNGETLPREWISDRDEYIAGTTPTIGAEVAYRLDTTIGHRISVTREPLASGEITYNGSALYISYQKDNVIGECKKFTVDEIAKYKPFNYSTQEKIVGEWVDGKAVYQKTINLGELPNAALKVVAHGISNFGHIVGLEGYAQTGTASTSIPYISTSGIEYAITIDIDDTNIQIFTGSDRSNMSGYLTIRYIKTTD